MITMLLHYNATIMLHGIQQSLAEVEKKDGNKSFTSSLHITE